MGKRGNLMKKQWVLLRGGKGEIEKEVKSIGDATENGPSRKNPPAACFDVE